MNINTTKLIPYKTEDSTCDKPDWQSKFKNQVWKDCEFWLYGYYYWYYTDKIAQVYDFEGSQIPYIPECNRSVDFTFKFPLYVKFYDPSNITGFEFNNVSNRSVDDKKVFVSSKEFTLKQPVSDKLTFYLATDVKIEKEYILNKIRVFYFTPELYFPKFYFCLSLSSGSWTDFPNRQWKDRTFWLDNFAPVCGSNDEWADWNTWSDYDVWSVSSAGNDMWCLWEDWFNYDVWCISICNTPADIISANMNM
jgi:hypothetical protein